MQMSQSIVNLSKALCDAQELLENPTRDKSGYNYKYADLPQVLEKIKIALKPHNLVFIQMVGGISDNKVSLHSVLMHSSGEYMSCTSEIYVDDKMKSKTQGVGSAITYLRRKSALSFFSIGEEDEIDARIENGSDQEKCKPKAASNDVGSKINDYAHALNALDALIAKTSNPINTKAYIFEKHSISDLSDLSLKEVQHLIAYFQRAEGRRSA